MKPEFPTRLFSLVLGLALMIWNTTANAQGRPAPQNLDPEAGISVILLGTGVPLPNPDRAPACTAVIAGDRVFLVDTGSQLHHSA